MADMFAPLVAQLKANPKTIVFTEGNDPRILEAASKLLSARPLLPQAILIFPLLRSLTLRTTQASTRW